MRSVWSIPTTPKREKVYGTHPTQKPMELLNRLVAMCTKPGDSVLDPFCGSGTTGVACVLQSRNFIGIDSDVEYVSLTKLRITKALEDT
jgi:site-specific DNA-methyltransferase (adenine-specific)